MSIRILEKGVTTTWHASFHVIDPVLELLHVIRDIFLIRELVTDASGWRHHLSKNTAGTPLKIIFQNPNFSPVDGPYI